MGHWFLDLPVVWMAVTIFVVTGLGTSLIWVVITRLAVGERARAFKVISPGLLPVLGVTFALLVGFMAVGVWSDVDHARAAVTAAASALRDTLHLSGTFGDGTRAEIRRLLRQHVEQAVQVEWPAMSRRAATFAPSAPLAAALQFTLSLSPETAGQRIAQQEMTTAVERALEARRQRIIISQGGVDGVKWFALIVIAGIALTGIAVVHADNRVAAAIATRLFAEAVALAVLLIASHDRPFTGEVSVRPAVLLLAIPPGA